MASGWYIKRDSKIFGPYSSNDLRGFAAEGRLDRQDLIARSAKGPWARAEKARGLFPEQSEKSVRDDLPFSTARAEVVTDVNRPAKHPAEVVAHSSSQKLGSYVSSTLAKGERVVFQTGLHWAAYIPSGIVILIGMLQLFSLATLKKEEVGATIAISCILLLMGFLLAGLTFLNIRFSEFAVTNRRVVMKTGLIRRKTIDLFLNKVDTVSASEGLIGRLLGYATVRVTVAVERQKFKNVARPLEFVRFIQIQQAEAIDVRR